MNTMTREEFRAIRKQLGLTQAELAQALGYAHVVRVGEVESARSNKAVQPLVARLMRAYAKGYRPDDWPEKVKRPRKKRGQAKELAEA